MTSQELNAFIKKSPIPVVCGVVTLLALATLYFRSGAIAEAEAELAQKSAEAEKYALNIKYSAQLKEQFEELATANKNIDSRLTRASQQGVNTQFFYKLERETGVKLVNFGQSPNTPTKAAKAAFIPVGFNVSVQGTMAQVLDFLRQLEGGTHYCRVLTATCSTSAGSRSGSITVALTLELLGLP